VRCSSCGFENSVDQKFCRECGTAIVHVCPECGATKARDAKFCGECGASLNVADGISAPEASPARASLPETALVKPTEVISERRRLTVLFSDLVGSTRIAAQLDPEEWRELAARYQQIAAKAVLRFDGYVAQYLGDGVLAFFGYPVAHEDDAERAVRAGLAIIEGVLTSNATHDTDRLPALAARIGIHVGPVVVGNSDFKSANVFGDTPNVAARVQAAAEPNTVLVSAAVQKLISGLFVVEDCGKHALKGIEQPVQLYRVINPTGVRRRRIYGSNAHTITPFVGRDEEMRLLLSRWKHACMRGTRADCTDRGRARDRKVALGGAVS
jgi:class 3 adenylate cyclase